VLKNGLRVQPPIDLPGAPILGSGSKRWISAPC